MQAYDDDKLAWDYPHRGVYGPGESEAVLAVTEREAALMLDTTPITTEITRLIATGTTEQALLSAVAHLFPNLSPAELSQALQVATAAAERQASRRH